MRGSRAVQKRLTDEETKKRDKRKLKSIFVGTGVPDGPKKAES